MQNPKQVFSDRQNRIKARREYNGLSFFSQGFRPFFLGAALWALISLPIWVSSWFGLPIAGLYMDVNWHTHEMIFGFAVAAIAGFLLTAIPNWTGRLPVRGAALAMLVVLWLIGRIAMLVEPLIGPALTAALDVVFLLAFSGAVFREIIVGRNWRNLKIALIIAALAIANIWFHLERLDIVSTQDLATRGATMLIVLLAALIGGRIIPSFTRNVLKRRGSTILPSPISNTDRFTLILTLVAGISFTLVPTTLLTAVLAAICSALHFERLTRWRGLHVLFEPMLWVLHLSYLWIGIGFALLSASLFWQFPTQSAAIHAFTTGAFSTLILAVMSRASRGHTGRTFVADLPTLLIYCSITLAAIFRVAGSIYSGVIYHQLSSGFWVAAFGLFLISYWSVLTGPDAREATK